MVAENDLVMLHRVQAVSVLGCNEKTSNNVFLNRFLLSKPAFIM